MKDFKILKILDKFKFIFLKFGIDYSVMRKILQLKLIMDSRRVPTIIQNNTNKNQNKNYFTSSLWFYLIMGVILFTPIIIMGDNYIFQMSIIFGIALFLISSTVISDFSSVLLDIRDKTVVLTKPVTPKTLSVSKGLHVFIYLFFISMALLGPSLVISLFKNGGLFFLLFLVEIILLDLFIIVLTTLIYFLILRFFSGEKLKDMITYLQVILSIILVVSYQFLNRLFIIDMKGFTFNPEWWQYLIIPIWYASPFEYLLKGNNHIQFIIMSLLVILIPLLAFIIYVKQISNFEVNLEKLNDTSIKVKKRYRNPNNWFLKLIAPSKEERTFYRFASKMMKNERQFKLKVYPGLGFALIFPFIFMFNGTFVNGMEGIADTKLYLFLYFFLIIGPSIVMMLNYSSNYKAAWIYKVVPIKHEKLAVKATFKAFFIKLIIPIFLLESAIFLYMFTFKIIPDLIIVFMAMLSLSLLVLLHFSGKYPFSDSYDNQKQNQSILVYLLMFIVGILALIHFLMTLFYLGIYIYLGVILVTTVVLWIKAFK